MAAAAMSMRADDFSISNLLVLGWSPGTIRVKSASEADYWREIKGATIRSLSLTMHWSGQLIPKFAAVALARTNWRSSRRPGKRPATRQRPSLGIWGTLKTETPLSLGALPAANVVGKPQSTCAKESSPISIIIFALRLNLPDV